MGDLADGSALDRDPTARNRPDAGQRLEQLRLAVAGDAGKAVLLVSVELEEIMSLADRILVMLDGTITGKLDADEADERRIGLLMDGITDKAQAA